MGTTIFIKILLQDKKWQQLQNQQKDILQQKNFVAGKNLPYDPVWPWMHSLTWPLILNKFNSCSFLTNFVLALLTRKPSVGLVQLSISYIGTHKWSMKSCHAISGSSFLLSSEKYLAKYYDWCKDGACSLISYWSFVLLYFLEIE